MEELALLALSCAFHALLISPWESPVPLARVCFTTRERTCSRESAAPGKREGRLEKNRDWKTRFMGVEVGVPCQGASAEVVAIQIMRLSSGSELEAKLEKLDLESALLRKHRHWRADLLGTYLEEPLARTVSN